MAGVFRRLDEAETGNTDDLYSFVAVFTAVMSASGVYVVAFLVLRYSGKRVFFSKEPTTAAHVSRNHVDHADHVAADLVQAQSAL